MLSAATMQKHSFNIRNVKTSSVILYPSNGHVTRKIEDLQLKPGQHEIEITGITPTAEKDSLKVEGNGQATITDLSVDLVDNKEKFFDIFPELEEEPMIWNDLIDDDDSDLDSEDDEEVKALNDKIEGIVQERAALQDVRARCKMQLSFLDSFCSSADHEHTEISKLPDMIKMYNEQRKDLFAQDATARIKDHELWKEQQKLEPKLQRAKRPKQRELEKRKAEKAKRSQKKQQEKNDEINERNKIIAQRKRYWPRKVYRVTVRIDVPVNTPSASRRSSVTSATWEQVEDDPASADSSVLRPVSLILSYVTAEASWTPRYEISLNSTQKTGSIVYSAQLKNETSETWRNTSVSVSTSQASFGALTEEVPWMHSWSIRISQVTSGQSILVSQEETLHAQLAMQKRAAEQNYDRRGLFENQTRSNAQAIQQPQGVVMRSSPGVRKREYKQAAPNEAPPVQNSLFGAAPTGLGGALHAQQSAFGSPQMQVPQGGALFGNTSYQSAPVPPPPAPMAPAAAMPLPGSRETLDTLTKRRVDETRRGEGGRLDYTHRQEEDAIDYSDEEEQDADEEGQLERAPFELEEDALEAADAMQIDSGTTTTHVLSRVLTLEPSEQTPQHKLVTFHLRDVRLSAIAVPKLRAAAFLRARVRNPSTSITLLKSPAGITLDGAFLGVTTFPRTAPGAEATLHLGIDPGVQITYGRPSVKRAKAELAKDEGRGRLVGFFSSKIEEKDEERVQSFRRQTIVTNEKGILLENLLVLDQIPVSEDDKLTVEITKPVGLEEVWDEVDAGRGLKGAHGKQLTNKDVRWGSARATLKRQGELCWNVSLDKGATCALDLEYEVRVPESELGGRAFR